MSLKSQRLLSDLGPMGHIWIGIYVTFIGIYTTDLSGF